MNTAAVQVQTENGKLVSARAKTGSAVAVSDGMDPFAQIIENMVAGMQEQAGQMQQQSSDPEQEEEDGALQGFGAMLLANPQGMSLLQQLMDWASQNNGQQMQSVSAAGNAIPSGQISLPDPSAWVASLQTMVASVDLAETTAENPVAQLFSALLAGTGTGEANSQLTALLGQLPGLSRMLSRGTALGTATGNEKAGVGLGSQGITLGDMAKELLAELSVVGKTFQAGQSQDAGDGQSLLNWQRQYQATLDVVKFRLQNKPTQELEEMDVDALQSQVNLQRSQPQSILAQAPLTEASQLVPVEDLANELQILSQKLPPSDEGVTLRLRPEELGEIVIKLMEKDGKTTMSITTASAQTAKLINQDIAALKEAVRPMQVEVREAVQQTAESPQSQMSFDMSGQQFTDRRQAFEQPKAPLYYNDRGEEIVEQQEEAGVLALDNNGLNMYI